MSPNTASASRLPIAGDLTPEQIERIGVLAWNPDLSPRDIASQVRGGLQYVQPLVATFRKLNAMAARDAKKNSTHLSKEIDDAYHAPGPGRWNNFRKANGDYDYDRITGLGLAAAAPA